MEWHGRCISFADILTPLVISGYVIGLPYGPKGVAVGYSAVMTLWVVPHIAWCVHGTMVSLRDILAVLGRLILCGIVAAAIPVGLLLFGHALPPLARLLLGGSVFAGIYLVMLLGVMRQKAFYLDLLRGFRGLPVRDEALVSA
jgi:PST family polysaccharide transporter